MEYPSDNAFLTALDGHWFRTQDARVDCCKCTIANNIACTPVVCRLNESIVVDLGLTPFQFDAAHFAVEAFAVLLLMKS